MAYALVGLAFALGWSLMDALDHYDELAAGGSD